LILNRIEMTVMIMDHDVSLKPIIITVILVNVLNIYIIISIIIVYKTSTKILKRIQLTVIDVWVPFVIRLIAFQRLIS